MRFQNITVIGVGLLGGSLGMAVRKRRMAKRVTGFVRRAASVAESEKAGAVSHATLNLREAVLGADFVVLCTPLSRMPALVDRMLPWLEPGAIVTDVGSVKESVLRALERKIAGAGGRFIGSHPMAGSEKTGVSAARANLFEGAVCVVTPTRRSDRAALRKVEAFWRAIGARVIRMPAAAHDAQVSRSSHLPHIAAAALTNLVLNPAQPKSQADLCANGFRDTTRIAAGSPEMWRDIALANRKNLDRALALFASDLEKFRRALKSADGAGILKWLRQAKGRRDGWQRRRSSDSAE